MGRGTGLRAGQDAYGQIYLALLEGRHVHEVMERDDGLIYCGDPSDYFAPFRRWPRAEKEAMRSVRGRVLDVGCGPGRVSLHLQARGHQVLAIDESPLAIEVARRRGVGTARVLSLAQLGRPHGRFDTVILLRNNFGLAGKGSGVRRLLGRLAAITGDRGRVITDGVDPARIENRALRPTRTSRAGSGRAWAPRFRVRWQRWATPWFRYLMLSPAEFRRLVAGTGWRVLRLIDDGTPRFVAVLEKGRRQARSAPGA